MSAIAVTGVAYAALFIAVGLVHLGQEVTAFDVDHDRVNSLNQGIPPFYEERLEELLNEGINRERLVLS